MGMGALLESEVTPEAIVEGSLHLWGHVTDAVETLRDWGTSDLWLWGNSGGTLGGLCMTQDGGGALGDLGDIQGIVVVVLESEGVSCGF